MSPRLAALMLEVRAVLSAGGPTDQAGRQRLVRRATSMIRDRAEATEMAAKLLVAIEYHQLLADMNSETPGPCTEGMRIVGEIEALSETT